MLSRKTFKYRLYPTPKQEQTLLFFLRRCRDLYNAGLEQRKAFYQMRHASLRCFDQINELPDLKQTYPAYQELPSHVLQDALRRLDKAMQAFFRRIRNGETPGYPRFKSTSRYHSFTYPDVAGWKLQENRLKLAGVGEVKVKLHRPLEDTIKTVTIRRDIDQWYVTFSCEVAEDAPLPPSEAAVGLDLGVLHFATLSTGEAIENPRHYRKGLKRLKVLSQIKNRRTKGSHRRKRAALALARAYRKVRNQRANFHQHLCTVKAERARRRVVLVDPKYTSQVCSGCGQIVKKELSERWHSCECGVELDRDHNAALNILFRGEASGPRCYGVVEASCLEAEVLHGQQNRRRQRVLGVFDTKTALR